MRERGGDSWVGRYEGPSFVIKLEHGAIRLFFRVYSSLLPVPDKYVPYRVEGGRIYLNIKESPMMLARAIGLYERHKRTAIRTHLEPGMTFVDAGANKGDFSLLAARLVGDSGKVLAFEPEPENCMWIRRSIELNGYRNISLYEVALGEKSESTQLYLGEKSGWHTLLPFQPFRNVGTVPILKRTLDSVLEDINHKRVNMIKIDVEGVELEVLRGARQTLSNNRDIVLLLDIHPQLGANPEEVCDFLKEQGFFIHRLKAPHNKLTHVDGTLTEILARR